MIQLTLYLKDGTQRSGCYPAWMALATLAAALKQPQLAAWAFEEAR